MFDDLTPQDTPDEPKKSTAEKKAELINALPWQPWRLKDLNTPSYQTPIEPLFAEDEHDSSEELTQVQVDQNELQRLQMQAQQQGHQQGYDAGQQQGYQAGFQAGQEAGQLQGMQEGQQQQAVLTEHWQHMVTEFQQTLDALDSVIASRLMQMALTAAKQVLGQPPICDGSALLNQIQQLIQQEPMFKGKPQLRVNPADFERVELQMGVTLSLHGWRLLADSQIHAGGCKVSAEDGDMDASLATRWHELCRLAAPGTLL
ncbi:flagellar assembly protein FliH [Ewingella sp. S1.OA.A_B6]